MDISYPKTWSFSWDLELDRYKSWYLLSIQVSSKYLSWIVEVKIFIYDLFLSPRIGTHVYCQYGHGSDVMFGQFSLYGLCKKTVVIQYFEESPKITRHLEFLGTSSERVFMDSFYSSLDTRIIKIRTNIITFWRKVYSFFEPISYSYLEF